MAAPAWCTIESDPGVLFEMLHGFGTKGLSVEELPTAESINALEETVYGIIMLFRWSSSGTQRPGDVTGQPGLYFAKQVIPNACATQALLNIVLNYSGEIELGPMLQRLYDTTKDLSPELRGESIANSDDIEAVHNSFASQSALQKSLPRSTIAGEAYHFTAFIVKDAAIYELDGLRGSRRLAAVGERGWKADMIQCIEGRIAEIMGSPESRGTLAFNLCAITKDPLPDLQQLYDETSDEGVLERITALMKQRDTWRLENIRRRHDYDRLVPALLKALAKKGILTPQLFTECANE